MVATQELNVFETIAILKMDSFLNENCGPPRVSDNPLLPVYESLIQY